MGAHGPMVPLLSVTAVILAAMGLDTYGYPAKQVGMLILAGLLVVAAAILATRPKA